MNINKINIKNEGYVYCKSSFYCAQDSLSYYSTYTFSPGINKLLGEIDSGNWAISYLLSMYKYRPNDFILFDDPQVTINNKLYSLDELSQHSCYMDKLYPLFSTDESVKEHIMKGLEYSQLNCSYEEIRNLFHIDNERFERPITGIGNEIFKAMAAVGFSYNKELFCFPWLSSRRYNSYHDNLTIVLQTLENLKKMVIVPVGISLS